MEATFGDLERSERSTLERVCETAGPSAQLWTGVPVRARNSGQGSGYRSELPFSLPPRRRAAAAQVSAGYGMPGWGPPGIPRPGGGYVCVQWTALSPRLVHGPSAQSESLTRTPCPELGARSGTLVQSCVLVRDPCPELRALTGRFGTGVQSYAL